MNNKHLILILLVFIFACNDSSIDQPTSSKERFIDSLISKMTIKEKIGQMNQYSVGSEMTGPNASTDHKERYSRFISGEVGSVLNLLGAEETRKLQQLVVDSSRLGIPLIFAYDVIHGYRTMFPIPLGETASWDLEAMRRSAEIAAEESAASGLQWTFSPMLDVSRDARWGRVMEGSGEDPYLTSKVGQAKIEGYQGDDLASTNTIAACAKHFAGYGFAESGKDYNSVSIGRHALHNLVMPPFRKAAKMKVTSFMNSFNDIDGKPSTTNPYLVKNLLKGKWKFDGLVVSDWNSIGETVNHGTSANLKDAARQAILAGTDIDMEGNAYVDHLQELINDGSIEETILDDAVRRILSLKYDLGLFSDPYKYFDEIREKNVVGNPKFLKIAKDVAAKSIVLLKNEGNLLPLESRKKIAIIGPLAKDKDAPLGNWRANARPNSAISVYEGVFSKIENKEQLFYAEGCKLSIGPNNFFEEVIIEQTDKSGFDKAIRTAQSAETVVMVLGEPAHMSGEGRSRSEIGLPGLQLELLKEILKVNKNVILVLMNGRPLAIPWEFNNVPAIVETWHLGSEAGNAIADVLYGDVNPSGKLPMSFPRSVGQLPLCYNHLNTGRPSSDAVFYSHYMDVDNTPLIPFGFGLSYSNFNYSDFEVSASEGRVDVKVKIENTSITDGEEIVQLYIQDKIASISRPILELKGFKKMEVKAGQSVMVDFSLSREDLSYYNEAGELIFEAGEFEVSIGPNSRDLDSKTVTVE